MALSSVRPIEQATVMAAQADKDPRLIELILQESRSIVRRERGVLKARPLPRRCRPRTRGTAVRRDRRRLRACEGEGLFPLNHRASAAGV